MASAMHGDPAKVVFSPALGRMTVKLLGEGPSTEVPRASSPAAPHRTYTSLARSGTGSASSGAGGTSTRRLEGADDSGSVSSGAAAAARGKAGPFFPGAARQARGSGAAATRTTMMLRNVPQTWSRDVLTGLLDSKGFFGQYDFVYLAMNIQKQVNLSYAFLNFTSPYAVGRFVEVFHGLDVGSEEALQVCLSKVQGLDANVRCYQNSPLMNESVPELYKPTLFCGGHRVPFPAPTTRLRGIRLRRGERGMGKRPENAAAGV